MIVRKIKPEELKGTKELFATAFEFTYDNKDSAMKVYEDTVSSPKSREDDTPLNKYAAFEDDDKTMMSCLSVNSYEMNFDGNLTKMAGIGGVSSLPQYRRRGGARAVLPPSRPKTIDTVVEVGMPSVLKMSSRMTSVAATARKIHITSSSV